MEEKIMKEIPLTITRNYVTNWGIWEAMRELAQNALDHADNTNTSINIGYHKKSKNFILSSKDTKLELSSLLLGSTSKETDPNQRGQFGEGYKLALVVLSRLGLQVTIYHGKEIWIPMFKYSKTFDTEVLTIQIRSRTTKPNDLNFVIRGLTFELFKEIRDKLIINRKQSVGYKTDHGTILTEEKYKGRVYVGGIYVCTPNLDLEHGFDFNPSDVNLGRDRGLMDSFDIQWLASKLWTSVHKSDNKTSEEISKLIHHGSSSVGYIGTSSFHDGIREKVAEDFYKNNIKTSIPVTSESESKSVLNKYDNAIPVIVNETVKRNVKDSSFYKQKLADLKERVYLTPTEVITKVLGEHKKALGDMHQVLTEELVPVSIKWTSSNVFKEEKEEKK